MHKENWDDLRFVLAVADTGSVSGAARRLGVNHATVLRRIAAYEERSGAALFERSAQGYAIPPGRQRIFDALAEVRNAVQAADALVAGTEAQLSGTIRLTSTDSLCQTVLPGIIARITGAAAGLRIDLYASNAHLDLSRLQADISIRPAMTLTDDLIGQRAGTLGFAVYTSAEARTDKWLGLEGPLSRSAPAVWMASHVSAAKVTGGADSFLVLREMIAAGMGQAILPYCVGASDARLRARPEAMPPIDVPIWVVSPSDHVSATRLQVLRDRLATALLASADVLTGEPTRKTPHI